MTLMTMEHLTKFYTERKLFEDVDFSIADGEKVGVIGINGTGKSTFLKIAAGIEEPDEGTVVRGRNLKIRYLPQIPQFQEGTRVLSYVVEANEPVDEVARFTLEAEAKSLLNQLDINDFDADVSTLSGGQRKRLALAAVLLSDSDLLILDEPTNHLDSEMAGWLEDYLKAYRGALIMVTHDRYFLDSVTNRIVEIDRGKLYSYSTNYLGFLQLKEQREAYDAAAERKRQSILRVEIQWMMRGARARSTKQKAHIQRYEELRDRKGPGVVKTDVQMVSGSSRMGRTTIEIEGLCKAYGDKVLIRDFTYIFLKNDRIGFIGHNGCGKSTLMKMIMGLEMPDAGSITIGQTIKIGYFSQENEYMDESLPMVEYLREGAEFIRTKDGVITAPQLLERFLFPRHIHYTRIEKLSGGEKRRLYLLRVLMEAPNVLILDEPTNDLDIQTMTILEDYLDTFDGIVIAVSHDRYFLDRVTRRIFAFEENGWLQQYEGGYTDYQIAHKARMEAMKEDETAAGRAGGQLTGRQSTGGQSAGGQRSGGQSTAGEITGGQAYGGQPVDGLVPGAQGSGVQADSRGDGRTHEKKLKFTYKEAKEYETIEEDIARMEERLDQIEEEMNKNASNYGKLSELQKEKDQLEADLEEKMERWEYLEDLAQKIEAAGK